MASCNTSPTLSRLPQYEAFRQKVCAFISQTASPSWQDIIGLVDELVRLLSIHFPQTQSYYQNFMLRFIYEEISLEQFQSDLHTLLVHEPLLSQYFAGFLGANLSTPAQRHAARQYFCILSGLPESMPNQSGRPRMKDVLAFNNHIQAKLQDRPGSLRDFILLNIHCLRFGSSQETRAQALELIGEDEELIRFFDVLWPAL